ncbi:sugar transferase [Lentibacillus salinarum]|uniref:Sugar transferase n=1 Tax=Lentibacillus salinarum TaxID=446820 RepID=A0ABW3ZRA1_9BACI
MEAQQELTDKRGTMYFLLKRTLDISVSFILLVLLAPLFLIICLVLYIKDGKPVFFKQTRIGKHNDPFIIVKFRTMTASANDVSSGTFSAGWVRGVPNHFIFKSNMSTSVTRIGRHLRKYSLDELPQLINVLKGEMSLVGPRPEIPAITQYYNENQEKRLLMKPGITGYAQINGRANMNHGRKIAYDLYYIENCSFFLDLKIIARTIIQVIKANGAV